MGPLVNSKQRKRVLAYIETEIPTNVGFGRGEDSNLLYITAGHSLYRIRVKKNGYHLP